MASSCNTLCKTTRQLDRGSGSDKAPWRLSRRPRALPRETERVVGKRQHFDPCPSLILPKSSSFASPPAPPIDNSKAASQLYLAELLLVAVVDQYGTSEYNATSPECQLCCLGILRAYGSAQDAVSDGAGEQGEDGCRAMICIQGAPLSTTVDHGGSPPPARCRARASPRACHLFLVGGRENRAMIHDRLRRKTTAVGGEPARISTR